MRLATTSWRVFGSISEDSRGREDHALAGHAAVTLAIDDKNGLALLVALRSERLTGLESHGDVLLVDAGVEHAPERVVREHGAGIEDERHVC